MGASLNCGKRTPYCSNVTAAIDRQCCSSDCSIREDPMASQAIVLPVSKKPSAPGLAELPGLEKLEEKAAAAAAAKTPAEPQGYLEMCHRGCHMVAEQGVEFCEKQCGCEPMQNCEPVAAREKSSGQKPEVRLVDKDAEELVKLDASMKAMDVKQKQATPAAESAFMQADFQRDAEAHSKRHATQVPPLAWSQQPATFGTQQPCLSEAKLTAWGAPAEPHMSDPRGWDRSSSRQDTQMTQLPPDFQHHASSSTAAPMNSPRPDMTQPTTIESRAFAPAPAAVEAPVANPPLQQSAEAFSNGWMQDHEAFVPLAPPPEAPIPAAIVPAPPPEPEPAFVAAPAPPSPRAAEPQQRSSPATHDSSPAPARERAASGPQLGPSSKEASKTLAALREAQAKSQTREPRDESSPDEEEEEANREAAKAAERAARAERKREKESKSKSSKGPKHSKQFSIVLEKVAGMGLGINVAMGESVVQIEEINGGNGTLVHDWNAANPNECVMPGDMISEVNGVAGDVAGLVQELKKNQILVVTILRP
eukprot:TRINITY_DN111444_c0_g1_i1.p1 TRINITY_DN111444_c0_g1~~TRINITY_DN111444_c0_g1_i1.p1  ORF type:complete len:535 (+),score=133.88 TRINITY_DN111444_c0_g1_i1:88-1692(+)